jgi:hypothetical protein
MDKKTQDIIDDLQATVHCLREELMVSTKRAEQAEARTFMLERALEMYAPNHPALEE